MNSEIHKKYIMYLKIKTLTPAILNPLFMLLCNKKTSESKIEN